MDDSTLFTALWGDRPALEENWINYKLFPPINAAVLEPQQAQDLLNKVLDFLEPIIGHHIWQHEPFALKVADGHESPACLQGRTVFGDNVDDEWFIVHLLLQATSHFTGFVGHVVDNDGQFLCIEAALHLPAWMTPQTCHDRIFLCNGTLRVLSTDKFLNVHNLHQGVELVQTRPAEDTFAPEAVSQSILSRTSTFPEAARSSQHRAHCILPYRVALILRRKPQLVAEATRRFYYRTTEEAALCSVMSNYPPTESSRVAVCVMFTRCLYAQLAQQEFAPPAPFQPWYSSSQKEEENEAEMRAADIGMRLSCGFEIMMATREVRVEEEEEEEEEMGKMGKTRNLGEGCEDDEASGLPCFARNWRRSSTLVVVTTVMRSGT